MPKATLTAAVNELYPDRYQVGRTKVYEYLKALGIAPHKPEGDKRGHITFDELEVLDLYVKIFEQDGAEAAADYAETRKQQSQLPTKPLPPANASVHPSALAPLPPAIETIVDAIAQRLQPQGATAPAEPDEFAIHRKLEEAAINNWHLSTQRLKQIIGRSPRRNLQCYGFVLHSDSRGWWSVHKRRRLG